MRLPGFQLERFFARFEFDVPYLLGSSDCEARTVGQLLDLEPDAEERLAALRLSYCESRGGDELREAVAGLYEGLEADDVLVHTASIEALFVLMNVTLDAGDRVVVHSPCFQPLAEVARTIGCSVAAWNVRPENGWRPDLEELERLLETGTRLLVINVPHNPTGYLPSREDFSEIFRLARERGVLVFCDEIFRFLEHDPGRRLPSACEIDERAVSLCGMSKVFGLPGLRTGWLASRNRSLLDEALGFKDYTSTCAPATSEMLAALALRHWRRIVERNRSRVVGNLELFEAFAQRHPEAVGWVRPGAGPVAFPRWGSGGDVDAFCSRLAEEAGVLLIPGSTFGMPGHVRVGFGRAGFPEGLERLERFLQSAASVL